MIREPSFAKLSRDFMDRLEDATDEQLAAAMRLFIKQFRRGETIDEPAARARVTRMRACRLRRIEGENPKLFETADVSAAWARQQYECRRGDGRRPRRQFPKFTSKKREYGSKINGGCTEKRSPHGDLPERRPTAALAGATGGRAVCEKTKPPPASHARTAEEIFRDGGRTPREVELIARLRARDAEMRERRDERRRAEAARQVSSDAA